MSSSQTLWTDQMYMIYTFLQRRWQRGLHYVSTRRLERSLPLPTDTSILRHLYMHTLLSMNHLDDSTLQDVADNIEEMDASRVKYRGFSRSQAQDYLAYPPRCWEKVDVGRLWVPPETVDTAMPYTTVYRLHYDPIHVGFYIKKGDPQSTNIFHLRPNVLRVRVDGYTWSDLKTRVDFTWPVLPVTRYTAIVNGAPVKHFITSFASGRIAKFPDPIIDAIVGHYTKDVTVVQTLVLSNMGVILNRVIEATTTEGYMFDTVDICFRFASDVSLAR